jgi:hypothetical protein
MLKSEENYVRVNVHNYVRGRIAIRYFFFKFRLKNIKKLLKMSYMSIFLLVK